jgi:hypothetical protein
VPAFEGGLDRWRVDHLFVDQDGIPTLVEVRHRDPPVPRARSTGARPTVYGQTSQARQTKGEESGLSFEQCLAEAPALVREIEARLNTWPPETESEPERPGWRASTD